MILARIYLVIRGKQAQPGTVKILRRIDWLISGFRYQKFRRLVSEALKQQYDSSVPVEDVVKYIHSRAKADPFSAEEIQSLLEKMDAEQTTIMLADGMIHVL